MLDHKPLQGPSRKAVMKLTKTKTFRAEKAWGKEMLASFGDVGVKVHWTDQPYRWHMNTGREVFMVVSGAVDMHYRVDGAEKIITLEEGDALTIEEGEEHVAHPRGEARILVVERMDSD